MSEKSDPQPMSGMMPVAGGAPAQARPTGGPMPGGPMPAGGPMPSGPMAPGGAMPAGGPVPPGGVPPGGPMPQGGPMSPMGMAGPPKLSARPYIKRSLRLLGNHKGAVIFSAALT